MLRRKNVLKLLHSTAKNRSKEIAEILLKNHGTIEERNDETALHIGYVVGLLKLLGSMSKNVPIKPERRYRILQFDKASHAISYCSIIISIIFGKYEKRPLELSDYDFSNMSENPQYFSTDASNEFSIEKALSVYPTNDQVTKQNDKVLQYFERKRTNIYTIKAQDQLIDATRNLCDKNVDSVIFDDINKTGSLPKVLKIFVEAKVKLTENTDVAKGLIKCNMGDNTQY
ncbi:unnamed protein product [Euphydryas editha]|uniref:Uncharacterized protein n=1 Tax=Euphydryas editha TaxID=104508 RepID=A0AAU9U9K2_EUPED|nr:unnamed protein product [Euphydryas editha]